MKVLMVGLGSVGRKHLAALRRLDEKVEVAALRSGKNTDTIEGVRNIGSLSELKDPPDFVVVSDPTFRHVETIRLVSALRKPLFIEKPLSHNLEGLDDLTRMLRENGI